MFELREVKHPFRFKTRQINLPTGGLVVL